MMNKRRIQFVSCGVVNRVWYSQLRSVESSSDLGDSTMNSAASWPSWLARVLQDSRVMKHGKNKGLVVVRSIINHLNILSTSQPIHILIDECVNGRPTWMGYGSGGAWEKLPVRSREWSCDRVTLVKSAVPSCFLPIKKGIFTNEICLHHKRSGLLVQMFVAGPSLLQSEVALCQEEWGTYAARAAELFRLKDGAWLNRAAHLGWPSKIGADYEGFLREFVASQGGTGWISLQGKPQSSNAIFRKAFFELEIRKVRTHRDETSPSCETKNIKPSNEKKWRWDPHLRTLSRPSMPGAFCQGSFGVWHVPGTREAMSEMTNP